MTNQTNDDQEIIPISDVVGVSSRALAVAKQLDHLPEGEFCLILVKHGVKAVPWHVIISRMERFRVMDIPRE